MNKLLLAIGLLFSASAFAQQSTNTAKIQFTGKYDSYIQNIFAFCSGPKPCKNCHPLVEKYEELCEKDQNQAKNKLLGSQALQGFGIDKPVQSQQQYNQISQNKPPPPPPVPYTPIVAIGSHLAPKFLTCSYSEEGTSNSIVSNVDLGLLFLKVLLGFIKMISSLWYLGQS